MNVAVITARGGSKRIPRKNIKHFHGRPIIEYPIETAHKSRLFKRVIVSTEDKEIASIAKSVGAEILDRPHTLADDKTTTAQVLEHALSQVDCDFACCIYPTAVFMTAEYLKAGFAVIDASTLNCVCSGAGGKDAGQFYWVRRKNFLYKPALDCGVFVEMPGAIDINTPEDWERAEKAYDRAA